VVSELLVWLRLTIDRSMWSTVMRDPRQSARRRSTEACIVPATGNQIDDNWNNGILFEKVPRFRAGEQRTGNTCKNQLTTKQKLAVLMHERKITKV
jgi:hypothetical protein